MKSIYKSIQNEKEHNRSVGVSETGNKLYVGAKTTDGRILPVYFAKEIKIVERDDI